MNLKSRREVGWSPESFQWGREEAYPAKETDGANKVRGGRSIQLSGGRVKKFLQETGSKPTRSGAL